MADVRVIDDGELRISGEGGARNRGPRSLRRCRAGGAGFWGIARCVFGGFWEGYETSEPAVYQPVAGIRYVASAFRGNERNRS